MTLNQLCQALQIGKDTGYKLMAKNIIKHRRVGKKYIIPKRNVIQFITSEDTN
jgi:excisionase family DNA binding protein